MNNLDKQYTDLLKDILENGIEKKDRTGTGTISVFGRQIRHKMSEGFPLLTTKKMAFKSMVTELLWFLQGDTNIKYLVDNGCNIWNGDAYKGYEKECAIYGVDPMSMEQFIQAIKLYKDNRDPIEKIKNPAAHFIPDLTGYQLGDLGPVYGKQWRKWQGWMKYKNDDGKTGFGSLWFDQILRLIADLEKNPDSRRLMVNAWNVAEIDKMTLPPCHYGFQMYTRELDQTEKVLLMDKKLGVTENLPAYYTEDEMIEHNIPKRAISLMWNQRSVDTFLGLPFNIASYGLLLLMLAKRVNMVPDELIGNLGDTHLYSNHIEQAKEQIGRKYDHEERHEMLKEAMGPLRYQSAVADLMPFGGGLSEYYDAYKIPYYSRIPFELPKVELDFEYTYFDGYITEFDKINRDSIKLVNYKSHPEIKAPLSN
jgi:thymidylate synthase